MVADENADFFPLMDDDVPPQFDVVMRGYDKRQVNDYVARIEAEIADLQYARDSALAISADRAAQLANREAHIESLRRQVSSAVENIDPASVSDRISDMLRLAMDEAAQVRRTAEQDAERTLSAARADAERVREDAAAEQQRLTAAASQRVAEAEQKLAEARVTAAGELETARAKVKQLTAEAEAERTRLANATKARCDDMIAEATRQRDAADALAEQRRQTADEDFEITLRERRRSADAEVAEILARREEARETLKALQKRIAEAISEL